MTQIMNLFEMIVELRLQNVVNAQIFLSWVRWFWDESYPKNKRKVWEEIRMNYTSALRKIIETGISVADEMSREGWDDDKGYLEFLSRITKTDRKSPVSLGIGTTDVEKFLDMPKSSE